MKSLLSIAVLLALTLTASGQLIRRTVDVDPSRGRLFAAVKFAHNYAEQSLSTEAGVALGIQAIANESSIAGGYTVRKYITGISQKDYFTSFDLASSIFPFKDFGLGLSFQTDLRTGEFLDKELTVGEDIICPCTGKVIGKKPDTRELTSSTKLFGAAGLVYKMQNFRIRTDLMFDDYNPNEWVKFKKRPYNNVVKIAMLYNIPLIQFNHVKVSNR